MNKSLCCYYLVHCLYIEIVKLPVVSSYLQQCANVEAELDSMIAHVSLEHVMQFVSLAIMQGSQDDLMNIVPSYYVCSISFFFQQSCDLETQVSCMKYAAIFL